MFFPVLSPSPAQLLVLWAQEQLRETNRAKNILTMVACIRSVEQCVEQLKYSTHARSHYCGGTVYCTRYRHAYSATGHIE